jgi:hypothetical protein
VFTEKEKEELKDMYNEEIREKKVYEDFEFDHDDLKVVQKREQQALALIRAGEMPSDTINGEIQVLLFDSQNFLEVPNKPYLYVKLKRVSYLPQGAPKERYLVKICSRYNQPEKGDIT